MWSKTVMGSDVLLLIECFITYSMLGWLVESIYMSFCNRKLTNRGFATGPFCPIYGFGGVLGYLLLHTLEGNAVALYLVGAVLATIFEFFVGQLMLRILHEVWWDYNDKFMNYKGIICLESTIAWGFYAVIIVRYLNRVIVSAVEMIPRHVGIVICTIIMFAYLFDFFYHLVNALDLSIQEYKDKIAENMRQFRAKW